MRFRTIVLAVLALVVMASVLLTGCGPSNSAKNLTPSTAKQLLQERYLADDQFTMMPYASIKAMLSMKTPTDFRPDQFNRSTAIRAGSLQANYIARGEEALHRLVKTGLVKETQGKDSLYEFSPTPEFLKFVVVSRKKDSAGNLTITEMLKLGQIRVDSVDNLLLGETETHANGHYTAHLDYNDVGRAIVGDIETHHEGTVIFGKQPDGAWVCVSY